MMVITGHAVVGSGSMDCNESFKDVEMKCNNQVKEEKVDRINSEVKLPIDDKPRIKWTEELHQIFVETIQRLGGYRTATPRNIVREMGVQGLTVRHVKSHLQKYRRHQDQVGTKKREAALIHGHGSSDDQTKVDTCQPVILMQTATNLNGQLVEPLIIPCIDTQNWNSAMLPTRTDQGYNSCNPIIPQNEMQSLLLHEEVPMHLLSPPAAEEHWYNSLMMTSMEGSTKMMAPGHGSSSALQYQTPVDIIAYDETFLNLDDWPF